MPQSRNNPEKPARPANLPKGRWLGDFSPLKPAERKLIAACAAGGGCEFNDGKRPDEAKPAYTIRAALIRFLALGGDTEHPVHEHGVRLAGAWISGPLDLDGATVRFDLQLRSARGQIHPKV